MQTSYIVSLRSLAENINPTWTLDDWMQWPPDMFALCAVILNRTGAYKLTLINTEWWNQPGWAEQINQLGEQWVKHTSNRLLGNPDRTRFKITGELKDWYEIISNEWNSRKPIDLDHLRVLGKLYQNEKTRTAESEAARQLAEAVVKMYILADASCSGLGFLGQYLKNENLEHRIFMATANLLLNNTGSLSTITKFHGIVLPKMRTPRSGLIARSLGHHLTFHTTEVEVVWRTFPRLESIKKNLNILAIPYPRSIETDDFEVVPDFHHPVRYFKGNVRKQIDQPFLLGLVKKVWDLAQGNKTIDILVLPEMALTEMEYIFLLAEFKRVFEKQEGHIQPPSIVAGIMKKNEKQTGYSGADDTFQNEVRMGVFFSGNWYTTTQRKHHRWQLDASQISQYGMETHLDPSRRWFEFCTIAQRRLTILAPNSWLALTALICEDLARQEPVSDVIRGIGPTLLMALLSDGPQLKGRWSGRYANVLADDPGTSVLSLTSLGMAIRSKPPKGTTPVPKPVVGLWKDLLSNWTELAMDPTDDALLFSLKANFEEEYTLDGRSDGGCASVFTLGEVYTQKITLIDFEPQKKMRSGDESDEKRFNNIRELSALQFAVDAVLDLLCCKNLKDKDFEKATNLILHLLAGEENKPPPSHQKFRQRIIKKIEMAWEDPSNLGISASAGYKGNINMGTAAKDLRTIIKTYKNDNSFITADLYDLLIRTCNEMLEKPIRTSQENLAAMSILYNLYNRVSNWNAAGEDCFDIDGLDTFRAEEMKKSIAQHINEQRKKETSKPN